MNIELFVRISPRTFPREVLQKFEESVEKKHIIRVCGWFSKNLSRVQITNSMSVHNIKINTKTPARISYSVILVRLHFIEVRLPSYRVHHMKDVKANAQFWQFFKFENVENFWINY